jgi:hypothetical protein
MNEATKWLIGISIFIVAAFSTITAVTVHSDSVIEQLVLNGASPAEARCSLTGSTHACIVAASQKR